MSIVSSSYTKTYPIKDFTFRGKSYTMQQLSIENKFIVEPSKVWILSTGVIPYVRIMSDGSISPWETRNLKGGDMFGEIKLGGD